MEKLKAFKRLFSKLLLEEEINQIKSIIRNKNLTIGQKIKFIRILDYLFEKRPISESYESLIEFCNDPNNIKNNRFDDLLDAIIGQINIYENKKREEQEKLHDRIMVIFHGRQSRLQLSDTDYYDLLITILNMDTNKQDYQNFNKEELISMLLENKVAENSKKNKFAIEVAANNRVCLIEVEDKKGNKNFENTYSYIASLIKKISNYDLNEEYAEKALQIAYSDVIIASILSTALNTPGLTNNKVKYIIDYYYDILFERKYLKKPCSYSSKEINKILEVSLYRITYCSKFMKLSDEDYKRALDGIKVSTTPYSMANILACDGLTKEKEQIALRILKDGEVSLPKPVTFSNKQRIEYDNKQLLAEAAISSVLRSQPCEEYERILTLMNKMIIKSLKNDGEDENNENEKCKAIAECISSLLSCSKLYEDNYSRFLYVVSIITSNIDTWSISSIKDFATSPMSKFYSDEDFQRIIQLIISSNKNKVSIVQLFTNMNVQYMDSAQKKKMFAAAKTDDEESINKLKEKLDGAGIYNGNVRRVFSGEVGEKILLKLKVRFPNIFSPSSKK